MGSSLLAQTSEFLNGVAGRASLISINFSELFFWVIAVGVLAFAWPMFIGAWLYWRNEMFQASLKWVLFEIRVPREIDKSPRGMEQVLGVLHSLRNAPGDFSERYIDGEVTRWVSLEIVSIGGEVHMYVRGYYKQADLIQAAFYSFYKDVEIIEVDDYMDKVVPRTTHAIYEQGYDMWGSEMKLLKEAAFPIKSYTEFEAIAEEHQIDPVSSALEILATVKKEEFVGIQFLLSPAAPDWSKKYAGVIERYRSQKKKSPYATTSVEFPGGPLPAFSSKIKGGEGDASEWTKAFMRTPGETDVLKAIERNLSKPAFNTMIRFMYLSPKSIFYDSLPRRGIAAMFNQYSSSDLNALVRNEAMSTRVRAWYKPYIFPKTRNEYRKQRLLHLYVNRKLPPETAMGRLITSSPFDWNTKSRTFEFSTESVATAFHLPSNFVLTGPHMIRSESRKSGPPAGLAIFGGEEEIEKMLS